MNNEDSSDIYLERIKALISIGIAKEDIIKSLSEAGLDRVKAERLIGAIENELSEVEQKEQESEEDEELNKIRKSVKSDIGWGFLALIISLAISIPSGISGIGVVIWGLGIYGLFRIIRGFTRLNKLDS